MYSLFSLKLILVVIFEEMSFCCHYVSSICPAHMYKFNNAGYNLDTVQIFSNAQVKRSQKPILKGPHIQHYMLNY